MTSVEGVTYPPSEPQSVQNTNVITLKVYKKRWLMLFLFVATSAANAVHWTNYAIIANIAIKYYEVSALFINWSSMIYMVMYIPLIIPATFIIEKKGLRFSLLLSVTIMCCGAWLKLLTLDRGNFIVAFLAQAIMGSAQIFILSVPPRISSIWFGAKQVSTACAIGVFGNQLGVALGFVLPPEIVKDSDDMNSIREDLKILYLCIAIPPTVLLILIAVFFESAPKLPPSFSQLPKQVLRTNPSHEKMHSVFKDLATNKDYILLLFSYGVNVGVFYAYSTLLNQLYVLHYPYGEVDAGFVGLTLIIGGMVGSVAWGIFLDKTHMFKETTLIVYCFAFIGMLGFTLSLYYEYYYLIFVSSGFLGFFMNGFLTVAFEFSAELTYPIPESTSSGILNAWGELLGLAMVLSAGEAVVKYNDLYANSGLTGILLVGLFISVFISGKHLKRRQINIRTKSAIALLIKSKSKSLLRTKSSKDFVGPRELQSANNNNEVIPS